MALYALSRIGYIKPMKRLLAVAIVAFFLSSCASTPQVKKEERELLPDSAEIHYGMGMVYLEERKFGDALSELTKATEMDPDKASYQDALGSAYFARGINDKALVHFKRAVALDRDYSEAYLHIGAVYINQRMWDESIKYTRMVLKNVFFTAPEYAYNNIGWALLNKGDYINAILNFRKAVELRPKYPMPYNNIGLAYERLERWEKAVDAYDAAIGIEPTFANPYLNKGLLLMNRDDHKGALETFETLVDMVPESSAAKTANKYIEILR